MEQYAEVVGSDASQKDYLQIAIYFQNNVDHFKAGQFFNKAGDYVKVCSYNLIYEEMHIPTHTQCVHMYHFVLAIFCRLLTTFCFALLPSTPEVNILIWQLKL